MHWEDLQLRRFYYGWQAYGQSKLANVLFTLELNRRLGPQSALQAFAADPGLVNTGIGTKGTPFFVSLGWRIWSKHGVSPEESARGIVHLLLDPSASTEAGIYWKDGKPMAPDPRGLDGEASRRLWEISEKMCGIS